MKSTLIHLSVAAFANIVSVSYAQAKQDKCIQIQVASVARRDVVAAGQSDFIINSSTDEQAKIVAFEASQTRHDFAIYADEKEPVRAQASALTQGGFVFIVVPKTANFDNDQAFGLIDRPIRFCSESWPTASLYGRAVVQARISADAYCWTMVPPRPRI